MQKQELVITRIQVEKAIGSDVSRENAWQVLTDFQRYPEIMDNVTAVRVFEQDDRPYSEWHVEVEEAPLTWTERDILDRAQWQIGFEAVQGDLCLFQGTWQIAGSPPALSIRFHAKYSLGLPAVERALGHILKEKMDANIRQMLDALSGEVCYGQK